MTSNTANHESVSTGSWSFSSRSKGHYHQLSSTRQSSFWSGTTFSLMSSIPYPGAFASEVWRGINSLQATTTAEHYYISNDYKLLGKAVELTQSPCLLCWKQGHLAHASTLEHWVYTRIGCCFALLAKNPYSPLVADGTLLLIYK
jgi:hypothetical protein